MNLFRIKSKKIDKRKLSEIYKRNLQILVTRIRKARDEFDKDFRYEEAACMDRSARALEQTLKIIKIEKGNKND